MVGTHKELPTRLTALIRIAGQLNEKFLNEVKFPARFIVIILGSPEEQKELEEIGRSISTLFNDEVLL